MSTEITTVTVDLTTRSYPIRIGPGLLSGLDAEIDALGIGGSVALVTASNIDKHYGSAVMDMLAANGKMVIKVVIDDAERAKNLTTVSQLYDDLLAGGLDRTSTLIALGGGVVGDITGFVAASLYRGIPWVQIPTTLLAMVDASIGGKTGVNHALGKNLIGAFHQPLGVLIDPELTLTLPERMIRSALAEMLKAGIIADATYLGKLEASLSSIILGSNMQLLSSLIATACRIKATIVTADEQETDTSARAGRKLLNFGHTIGHALEAAGKYEHLHHGESVALGMAGAAYLSASICGFTASDVARIEALVDVLQPPGIGAYDMQVVRSHMAHDKKRRFGQLSFVLLEDIGSPLTVDGIEERQIIDALERLQGRFA